MLFSMLRAGYRWMTAGLVALLLWPGVLLLASPRITTDGALAPCHRPVPRSSQSPATDHSCCATGHNQTLASNHIEAPSLQIGELLTTAALSSAVTANGSLETAVTDAGPPPGNNSPLRI